MNSDEFEQFRHDAVRALMDLNEECGQLYNIGDRERWDYDFDSAKLVFSQGGIAKVVASIQVVGSTSKSSNTWLWAWANESLPSRVTKSATEVQKFGESEALSRLTDPQLVDDEHLGWEMAAIAVRIIGAKGAYRCPSERGFLYLALLDIQMAEGETSVSSILNKGKISCDTHGTCQQAFVCAHLLQDPKQEWFHDEPSPDNPWPDAWCGKCEALFQEAGEWNDDNSHLLRIKLLCHQCYESLRTRGT